MSPRRAWPVIGAFVAVALVSALFRLYRVGDDFWFFADQFDHWGIASRAWSQLPGHGTPRMDGGFSYGPIYYWVLWLAYHGAACIGPPLPHIGGAVLGIVHVCAELVFLACMLRAQVPLVVASTVSLLIASAPTEASLSHTLWNPNLSAAFFLLALSGLLETARLPRRRTLLACVAASGLAVHSHTPCLFFAAPIAAAALWIRWQALPRQRSGDLLWLVGLLALLQLPYLLAMPTGSHQPTMDAALSSPLSTLLHLHAARATTFVVDAVALLVLFPLPAALAALLLALCLFGLFAPACRGEALSLACVAGIALTAFGWALYPKDDLQFYWVCASMPGFAFALVWGWHRAAQRWLSPRAASRAAWGTLALAALAVPPRFHASSHMDRMPAYRHLVDLACEGARHGAPPTATADEQQRFGKQLDLLYVWCGGVR